LPARADKPAEVADDAEASTLLCNLTQLLKEEAIHEPPFLIGVNMLFFVRLKTPDGPIV
jgi:hypothetical protein